MNEFIAKIEGHGNLTIDWEKNQVKLNIHEGERLFEGLLVGRTAEEMYWITPRICGICPIAHNLASLAAVEDALGIKVNSTTILLRDLMQCGQMIQSHALHLFFLSLPDYLGIDRGTELAQKNPEAFKSALALKGISDEIAEIIAGRSVHPTRTTIGGFHKIPFKSVLEKLLNKLKKTEKDAKNALELVSKIDFPELKVELQLAAQDNGLIIAVSSNNIKGRKESSIRNYKEVIEEEVRDYSTAKFGKYRGEEMLVGSLARLAVYGDYDKKYEIDFGNPFHNNLAQAIEILTYHQKAQKIIEQLLDTGMDKKVIKSSKNSSFKGIGATEAPRGGLYHEVHLDKDNIITHANIITPTVQNLTSIEKSANALLKQTKNRSKKEIERLLVMLVRAYDPCITCSVH
ncbi:MAG: nickel-dependent hydrogenase large subunit [Parcubacteria group bacterium]|nr:nickel-dependent hydrogenase large subunit [Parcubacteria group bacterium]